MNQEWSERCKTEATKNVVFLLQRINLVVVGVPSGYEMGEDGNHFVREEDEAVLSIKKAFKHSLETDDGQPAVIKELIAEKVFLTREEAESFAKAREYNYSYGWHVYGIPCEGEMVTKLDAILESP